MPNLNQKILNFGSLTSKEIVRKLNRYVIAQDDAKRAVAIALRNRWRRQQLPEGLRERITPKNIILIGPSGVGKTEVARQLAKLVDAPFIKVEATNYTEVGYVGANVESMVIDLLRVSARMVREEMGKLCEESQINRYVENAVIKLIRAQKKKENKMNEKEREAKKVKEDKIRNGLDKYYTVFNDEIILLDEPSDKATLRKRFRKGELDGYLVAYDEELMSFKEKKEDKSDFSISRFLGKFLATSFTSDSRYLDDDHFSRDFELRNTDITARSLGMTVVEDAVELIRKKRVRELQKLTRKMITEEAIKRVEEFGIIFIDEIDKIAEKSSSGSQRVSGVGVQRQLLSLVEGCTVSTPLGDVRTDHILFIAAGAFHLAKPSDLIPEFQGRFPIRVELEPLTTEHYRRILTEPVDNMLMQYTELMRVDGVDVEITDEAISKIAELASLVNSSIENIGARRLYTILERVFEDLLFAAPDIDTQSFVVTADYVQEKMAGVIENHDSTRYIL